jgi:hypothetical protein
MAVLSHLSQIFLKHSTPQRQRKELWKFFEDHPLLLSLSNVLSFCAFSKTDCHPSLPSSDTSSADQTYLLVGRSRCTIDSCAAK